MTPNTPITDVDVIYQAMKWLACAFVAAWAGCTLSACGVTYVPNQGFTVGSTSFLEESNKTRGLPEHTEAERRELTAVIEGGRYGR